MSGKEIEFTADNFEEETKTGITLIDFWAPWCGPCRIQGPIIEKVAQRVNGNAKIGKLNVDQHPAIAARFGVTGIPTLILLKEGEEVERFVGIQAEDALVEKVESLH
jgi:thioredoxin 1